MLESVKILARGGKNFKTDHAVNVRSSVRRLCSPKYTAQTLTAQSRSTQAPDNSIGKSRDLLALAAAGPPKSCKKNERTSLTFFSSARPSPMSATARSGPTCSLTPEIAAPRRPLLIATPPQAPTLGDAVADSKDLRMGPARAARENAAHGGSCDRKVGEGGDSLS